MPVNRTGALSNTKNVITKTSSHESRATEKQSNTLGSLLQTCRAEQGVSLRNVAGRAKISPGLLSRIERDYVFPSEEVLSRIGEIFEINIEQLKKYDARVHLYDLRRMIQKHPPVGAAIHAMIEQVKQGKISLEDVTDRLHAAGFIHEFSRRSSSQKPRPSSPEQDV